MFKKISKRSSSLFLLDLSVNYFAFVLAIYLQSGLWNFVFPPNHPVWVVLVIFMTSFYIFDFYYPFKYFQRGRALVDVFLV